MILITGIPSEAPVKLVTDAAEKAEIPYVLFNQRNAHLYDLSVKFSQNVFSGILQIDGSNYDLESFSGIYVRMMDNNFLPEISDKVFNYIGHEQANKSFCIHKLLLNWMDMTSCRIFNRPVDMLSNLSKPYQAQIISCAGLKVPATCITTQPKTAKEFYEAYQKVIFKSISSVRSIVQELNNQSIKDLQKIVFLPTQFQQKLEGVNIRVHVVGDVLFATKAESKVVDYRYSRLEGEETHLSAFNLPAEIEEHCFKVAKLLNLPLAGIDLFLTSDNQYYCFEVNPSPGYSYFQQSTGQDIATAIVNWLEFGTAK